MTAFQFILAALACYRLTVLIARDAGPFGVFRWLRSTRFKVFSCPYCVSLWAGALIESCFYLSGVTDTPVIVACIILSLSAVAIMLDRLFSSDHQS